ncbi:spermatogenesis-associated protein 31D1 [Sorex araneus]|uniref:spermatogenesis-associated protein 31D1 n=1 Tax=Sorex araneus TaxID=42254 RepID=UPI002433B439|nr:spermatogenesis-associated protein 31D1 [Sorex araneus]
MERQGALQLNYMQRIQWGKTGHSSLQSKEEKERGNIKSPEDQHHTNTHFRQLLCPDPTCEVCNMIAAEVNEFLGPEALIDSFTSVAPMTPMNESSFNLCPSQSAAATREVTSDSSSLPCPSSPHSILKSNQRIHIADCDSPILPSGSLPPEPFPALDSQFHLDHHPPPHLSFSPFPSYETQTVDPIVLQIDPLSCEHTKSPLSSTDSTPLQDINPLPDILKNSPACHQPASDISVPIATDFTITVTESKSITIFLKSAQENPPVNSPPGLSKNEPTIIGKDHSNLEISKLSWSQTQPQITTSSIWSPSTRDHECLAPHSPKTSFGVDIITSPVETDTSGKISTPKSTVSYPNWPNMVVSKKFQEHNMALSTNTLKDSSQKKYTQLFWGLPSLHSESLCSTTHLVDNNSPDCIFNKTLSESTRPKNMSLTLPLSETQHHLSPQVLISSKSLPFTETQCQPQVVSTYPSDLLIGTLPQSHYRTQEAPLALASSDIQCLEWHVLQKQQSIVWGLPPMVQRSQQEFYPPAPNAPGHRSSLVRPSISILQGDFPLSTDLTKKLEHHLHKRLIQHRWGLPRRIWECLSLWMPPEKYSERDQINRNLDLVTSQSGNIHHSSVDPKMGEENRKSSDKTFKHHLSDQRNSSEVALELGSDQITKDKVLGMSENDTEVVEKNQSFQNLELTLKYHLRKKFEEIHEGQLPRTVTSSRRTSKVTLSTSPKSLCQAKQRKLTLAESEQVCLNTVHDLPFFDSRVRKSMETHIKRFHKQMIWGLPTRVCESIECCKLSTTSSCSSMPSLTNWYSKGRATSRDFNPSRQNVKFLEGDGSRIKCSSVGHSVSDTSPLKKERQNIPKQSPFALRNALNEEIQTLKIGKIHLMPVKDIPIGKENLRESLPANTNLAARQDQTRHESKMLHVRFSNKAEIHCDLSKPQTPRETLRVEKQPAFLSNAQKHVTINRVDTSPKASAKEEAESDVFAGSAAVKPPFSQHFTTSPLKCQLIDELKITLKSKKECEAKGQAMSQSSDDLTYKTSVTQSPGVHGNPGISPALHVQLEDDKVRLEGKQEPWLPKHVLRPWRDEALPRAPENVSSCPGSESEELGAGDAHVGKADGGGKSCPSQIRALQEMQGSKSRQSPFQRGQPPPENYYRKKVKGCFQLISPRTKIQRQESPQEIHRPISFVPNRGLVQKRATPLGRKENPRTTTDTRKSPREKLGHVHPLDGTCPPKPSPTPMKFKTRHQVAVVQVQRKAVQAHCLKEEIPSPRVATAKSHQPAAVYSPQRCPRHNRRIPDKASLQKAVASQDQHVCRQHCPSRAFRKPGPQPGT